MLLEEYLPYNNLCMYITFISHGTITAWTHCMQFLGHCNLYKTKSFVCYIARKRNKYSLPLETADTGVAAMETLINLFPHYNTYYLPLETADVRVVAMETFITDVPTLQHLFLTTVNS